jgi:hypothetical protein
MITHNDDLKIIALSFDQTSAYFADFTIEGFSNIDLEIIRSYANISGQISIYNHTYKSYQKISPIFPNVAQMSELRRIKYQCYVFGKLCQSLSEMIKEIQHKDKKTKEDRYFLKRYWVLRKLCTLTQKNLARKIQKLKQEYNDSD